MQSFFSGTDWSQLEDRGVLSNYFLMLIVNFKGEYVAKVAFKAEKSGKDAVELNFANNLDGRAPLTLAGQSAKEVLVVMDCKIEFEKPEKTVEDSFSARYDAVKTALAEEAAAKRVYTPAYVPYTGYGVTPKRTWRQTEFTAWDDEIDDITVGKFPSKKKGIMDLTDKEWNMQNTNESTITEKDAFFALSSYLSSTYDKSNYEPPLDLIIDLNKQLKKKAELEEYLMEFSHGGFKTHVEGIHLNCTPHDHMTIMEHLIKYLDECKYNRLAGEMLDELKDMLEDEVNDFLDNHTSFGSPYEQGGWID
jgi:predicted HicB family RNase H-like nuclease